MAVAVASGSMIFGSLPVGAPGFPSGEPHAPVSRNLTSTPPGGVKKPGGTAAAVPVATLPSAAARAATAGPSAGPAKLESEIQLGNAYLNLAVIGPSSIDAVGAIGYNQGEYHSVGEQRHIGPHVLRGLVERSTTELSSAVLAMEYSFAHQNPDGSFQVVEFANMPNGLPTFDPIGVSFFYADLGRSLSLLREDSWFMTSVATSSLRQRVAALTPAIVRGLNWLMSPPALSVLQRTGRSGTNRWTFGANALALTGQYLSDRAAVAAGLGLLNDVLEAQQPDGTLPELGGYDSSYQGVSLSNMQYLLLDLNTSNDPVAPSLERAIARGVAREQRSITPPGQIITVGNTRVYCGGGTWLGEPKGGDYRDVVIALAYQGGITANPSLVGQASRVASYYAVHAGGPAACA